MHVDVPRVRPPADRSVSSWSAEFNAHSDPEAAHMIFVAFEKLTMVGHHADWCPTQYPGGERSGGLIGLTRINRMLRDWQVSWELTKESALSWQHFDDFLAKADVSSLPQGQLIHAVCKPFIRDRETSEGAIICDAVAMAVALDPSVIRVSAEARNEVEMGRL